MIERLSFLWPEIALFATTCLVMVVGLSKNLGTRKLAVWIAGAGLLVALFLSAATTPHLAEAAWHHPDLAISYGFVIVKLITHDAKGITEKDFALAKKIEEVIQWQPAKEPGAVLEGTPNDDVRFKYVKYDN